MSECQGEGCTHPDCTHVQRADHVNLNDAVQVAKALGFTPEKWASMPRRDRRRLARVAFKATKKARKG